MKGEERGWTVKYIFLGRKEKIVKGVWNPSKSTEINLFKVNGLEEGKKHTLNKCAHINLIQISKMIICNNC